MLPRFLGLIAVSCIIGTTHASEVRSVELAKHQDWETRLLGVGDKLVFRAVTLNERNNLVSTLSIDRSPPQCKPEAIIVRIISSAPRDTDVSQDVFGQMRVDERAIRNVLFKLTGQVGNQHSSLILMNWDREESFTNDLVSGKTLRIRLTETGKDYFLNFSLIGFDKAFVETRKLCELGRNLPNTKRNDSDYFK